MKDNTQNSRTQRLNVVMREVGVTSVNAFALEIGTNQRTSLNYMTGKREPTADFILRVIKRYPEYNQEWLLSGEGEKYNRKYVEDSSVSGNGNIVGNTNSGSNIVENSLSADIVRLYNELVDSYRQQIETLKRACESKDKQIELLEKIIESK